MILYQDIVTGLIFGEMPKLTESRSVDGLRGRRASVIGRSASTSASEAGEACQSSMVERSITVMLDV